MREAVRSTDTRRLTREDWIDGATRFLSTNNVDALRLDRLSRQLGVTKGSFYWHFQSREELLDAVIDSWRQSMISDIEAWLRHSTGTPVGRLRRLLRLAISPRMNVPGGPLELTLRDWARRDPRVDSIVRHVDAQRVRIVENLYRDAGFSAERAAAHALLHMTYVIGGRAMLFDADPAELERRWRIGEDYLAPSPARA